MIYGHDWLGAKNKPVCNTVCIPLQTLRSEWENWFLAWKQKQMITNYSSNAELPHRDWLWDSTISTTKNIRYSSSNYRVFAERKRAGEQRWCRRDPHPPQEDSSPPRWISRKKELPCLMMLPKHQGPHTTNPTHTGPIISVRKCFEAKAIVVYSEPGSPASKLNVPYIYCSCTEYDDSAVVLSFFQTNAPNNTEWQYTNHRGSSISCRGLQRRCLTGSVHGVLKISVTNSARGWTQTLKEQRRCYKYAALAHTSWNGSIDRSARQRRRSAQQ